MKRKNLLSLLLCAVMLTCAACSGGSSSAPAQEADLPAVMEQLLAAAPIDDPLTLGETDMLDFYGIEADQMKQFSAVLNSNGISAQEIVLVEAVDDTAAGKVLEKLTNRLSARTAEADGYLPDEYEILSTCEAVADGCYVRLIIHAQADELIEIYNNAIGK